MRAEPQAYIDLIRAFVEHCITASEFDARYLALFKAVIRRFADEEVFETLNGLFADVDAYVADPALRDSEEGLNDEQLHACAVRALAKLTSDSTN
jgi:hypothetical protein